LGSSAGLNWYAYVDNNPVSSLDPLGLQVPDRQEVFKDVTILKNPLSLLELAFLREMTLREAVGSRLPGPADGPQGAFRHCLWSCLMTEAFDTDAAKAIADEHERAGERRGDPASDREMDLANNEAGRQCAADSGSGGKSGNKPAAKKSCKDKCWDRLKAGQLFGPGGVPLPAFTPK